MPTPRRTASMSTSGSVTSTPSTTTCPLVGTSSRLTHRSSVDLPDPDGPMTQTTSPRSTLRSMPRRTSFLPNRLVSPWTTTAGPAPCVPVTRTLSVAGLEPPCDEAERDRDDQIAQTGDEDRRDVRLRSGEVPAVLGELPLRRAGRRGDSTSELSLNSRTSSLVRGGSDDPESLRDDDARHRPRVRHAEGPRCFGLALRDGLDACADRLGHVGRRRARAPGRPSRRFRRGSAIRGTQGGRPRRRR